MDKINDKVILITGSTDGLGKQVALDLAAQGATILLQGRNREKGDQTLREIRQTTGSRKIEYYNADLSSLDEVRCLADEVTAKQKRLDVLVNNAGIGAGQQGVGRELSKDGYELRFAVNYLSHFLLTLRLLELLRSSAPSRIVNVSSVGQYPIDFDNVMLEKNYDGYRAYRQSKLAQIQFTFELADQLKGSSVTVNCLHPASLMNTKMVMESSYFGAPMTTIAEGADAVEYLALSPELDGVSGEYFNQKQLGHANPQAYDEDARKRLWALSERWVKLEKVSNCL